MKRRSFILSVLLVCMNLFVAVARQQSLYNNEPFTLNNVETLNRSESDDDCIAGGQGSSSCSIEGGIEIVGNGVTVGCSVSCNSGYYACCGLTSCDCVKE